MSAELREVLEPLLKEIESLTERIKEYDVRMEKIARESYPQVTLPKQVKGVGTQIALTYVLTLDDPHRFAKSREVDCFLGLKPGRRDSGQSQPQMHISKEGDRYLRTRLRNTSPLRSPPSPHVQQEVVFCILRRVVYRN